MANKNHDVKVIFAGGKVKFPGGGACTVAKGADDSIVILRKGSNFKFTKIRFGREFNTPKLAPASPFTTSVQDDRIVVIDKNRNNSRKDQTYKYYITVQPKKTGSKKVESKDPRIRNISF